MTKRTFKSEERERLLRWARRLVEQLEDDALLEVLVPMTLWNVFLHALPVCGEQLMTHAMNWFLSVLRDRSGWCQHCETELNPSLTHPPVCEACDARLEKECDEMERQADRFDEGEIP